MNVLVVDDDALVLMTTAMMVGELGHEPTEASSALEALDLLQRQEFDLVITDYAMPEMTGAELILQLSHSHPELPCILATGYAVLPPEMRIDAVRLSKPFNENRLATAIELAFAEPCKGLREA